MSELERAIGRDLKPGDILTSNSYLVIYMGSEHKPRSTHGLIGIKVGDCAYNDDVDTVTYYCIEHITATGTEILNPLYGYWELLERVCTAEKAEEVRKRLLQIGYNWKHNYDNK